MITLVDTNIWSLGLRRDRDRLNSLEQRLVAELHSSISAGLVRMIGPIRQELLTGVKSAPQFEILRDRLRDFPDEPLLNADFERAATMSNELRSAGIASSPTDCLIAAVAKDRVWAIFSGDNDFQPFAQRFDLRIVAVS